MRADKNPHIAIVLLAAGASRRMHGRDKLLIEIDGRPLLRRAARQCCASDAASVLVVLRNAAGPRAEALQDLPLEIVKNSNAHAGMAASISAGVRALDHRCDAALLALADMPDLTTADLNNVMKAYDPKVGLHICRASDTGGQPGHPVLFGRRYFAPLSRLSGDQGARALIAAHLDEVVTVPLPAQHATVNLDTEDDWARYFARTKT